MPLEPPPGQVHTHTVPQSPFVPLKHNVVPSFHSSMHNSSMPGQYGAYAFNPFGFPSSPFPISSQPGNVAAARASKTPRPCAKRTPWPEMENVDPAMRQPSFESPDLPKVPDQMETEDQILVEDCIEKELSTPPSGQPASTQHWQSYVGQAGCGQVTQLEQQGQQPACQPKAQMKPMAAQEEQRASQAAQPGPTQQPGQPKKRGRGPGKAKATATAGPVTEGDKEQPAPATKKPRKTKKKQGFSLDELDEEGDEADGKTSSGKWWKDPELGLFVDMRCEVNPAFEKMGDHPMQWQKIQFRMASKGYKRTVSALRSKWDEIYAIYRNQVTAMKQSGGGDANIGTEADSPPLVFNDPLYNTIHTTFKHKPNAHPAFRVQTTGSAGDPASTESQVPSAGEELLSGLGGKRLPKGAKASQKAKEMTKNHGDSTFSAIESIVEKSNESLERNLVHLTNVLLNSEAAKTANVAKSNEVKEHEVDPELQAWLEQHKFGSLFAQNFARHFITFSTLPYLNEQDLASIELPLGPRRVLWAKLKEAEANKEPPFA